MLNKPGYFAFGIIQKEGQKKGGNDRIWQDDILKYAFKQLIWDKEGQYTAGFISNACQWNVSKKVGSLKNSDDHFIQWLFSVSHGVWNNWSLGSRFLTCYFFNLYQIPIHTEVPSEASGRGGQGKVEGRQYKIKVSVFVFQWNNFFLSFQHGKSACFHTKLFIWTLHYFQHIFH